MRLFIPASGLPTLLLCTEVSSIGVMFGDI
jgi:hypothetical protein